MSLGVYWDGAEVGLLYSQAPGRVEVTAFECEQGGFLCGFFRGQFEALWTEASVRP